MSEPIGCPTPGACSCAAALAESRRDRGSQWGSQCVIDGHDAPVEQATPITCPITCPHCVKEVCDALVELMATHAEARRALAEALDELALRRLHIMKHAAHGGTDEFMVQQEAQWRAALRPEAREAQEREGEGKTR